MFSQELPIKACPILVPQKVYQSSTWPVVACDQYTSEADYWKRREQEVGDQPSTLRLILPEYILEEKAEEALAEDLDKIWQNMHSYLNDDVFESTAPGYLFTSRVLPDGSTRRNGVVLAIDLDAYLTAEHGLPAIRASEKTVESRLPIRIQIRAGASLELPHVLLLIDDPEQKAVESLAQTCLTEGEALYDIDLPEDAGHVSGYFVAEQSQAALHFTQALRALPSFTEKGLFAYVGDGNHSLAAAKRIREKNLAEGRATEHSPDRYALVELINIHDPGLIFHPIHQLIYESSLEEVLDFAKTIFSEEGPEIQQESDFNVAYTRFLSEQLNNRKKHTLLLVQAGKNYLLSLNTPSDALAISAAHRLSGGMQDNKGKRIDYIHGEEALAAFSRQEHVAVYLPNLRKRDFFPALEELQVLPKKTFSLGEAAEKRHYVEARCIQ